MVFNWTRFIFFYLLNFCVKTWTTLLSTLKLNYRFRPRRCSKHKPSAVGLTQFYALLVILLVLYCYIFNSAELPGKVCRREWGFFVSFVTVNTHTGWLYDLEDTALKTMLILTALCTALLYKVCRKKKNQAKSVSLQKFLILSLQGGLYRLRTNFFSGVGPFG